jgi:hypothetical protein
MGMKYIIYEITPLDKSLVYSYIGSTKNFRTRKFQHKNRCYYEKDIKNYNLPVYQFIRENGGWDAFEMNPIEEIEVENKTQARIREQFFKNEREKNIQMLNAYNPYSGLIIQEYRKQYREENSEKIKEANKKYRDENKQKINEKQNEKHTCACGGKFTRATKSQHLRTLKHQAFVQNCATPTTL